MPDRTRYTEYCFNRMMHLNTPAKITSYGEFREIDGVLITEETFKKLYPLKIRPKARQKENPDNTKKFML